MPADLSREGPFEVFSGAFVEGEVPMVLNSLPGCPYRMTSYDRAEIAEVDPASVVPRERWGAQVGAAVDATSGTLGSDN